MGTVKGQEGLSKEREVQEEVLGHKTRFLGGNGVQAPPQMEQGVFDPLVTLRPPCLTCLQALLQICPLSGGHRPATTHPSMPLDNTPEAAGGCSPTVPVACVAHMHPKQEVLSSSGSSIILLLTPGPCPPPAHPVNLVSEP